MSKPPSALLRRTLLAATALAFGFGLHWIADQKTLGSPIPLLEKATVWLSPITSFGWLAMNA